MYDELVIALGRKGALLIIMMSAPIIFTAMCVGLMVAITQAITQIQEQTLSFVPKSLSVYAVLIVLGPWLLSTILQFLTYILTGIPDFLNR